MKSSTRASEAITAAIYFGPSKHRDSRELAILSKRLPRKD
jgi:hypothetical protein